MARSAGMRALIESSVDRCFNGLPHDARYERYLNQFTGQDPEAYAQTVISLLDLDITAIAAEVACPTLLVPGAHDVLMPAEDGPALARMIPDARLESMPAAAHFVPQQAPEPFAQMALAFLDAVIAGRGRKGSPAAPGG
jgi:pimeloyl-ACP methyl ester carboxylesterase